MPVGVLGVDIGGVIIDRINDGTDTSFFSENYLHTTEVPGVFEALRRLVAEKFGDKVFLVSKCGQRTSDKTLAWLEYHDFHRITGVGSDAVHFCRERHQKAPICQKLGITHFVDDRLEILGRLATVSTLYLFQPNSKEIRKFAQFLSRVHQVQSWQEILDKELPK